MTTDLHGMPIEIKKLGRNALLSNDFSFGLVKKITQKNILPKYDIGEEILELNQEGKQTSKKKEAPEI